MIQKRFSHFRHCASLFLVLWIIAGGAYGETLTLDLGAPSGSFSGRLIQLFLIFSVLSIAPSLVIMATSFTRIVIVFSFLRHSLGLQQSPPNMVLISLSLFLSALVMGPTFEKAYEQGVRPLIEEKIQEEEALEKCVMPFREFMMNNVREKDLRLFMDLSKTPILASPEQTPLRILTPAFMISELRRAFEIGFLLFIPFLVIDLVVASVLMAMGMMMVPPAMIALPLKVIFFVLIDGWLLLSGSLVKGFQ